MFHHKAYKFRLYPSQQQIQPLNQTFGCARYVYNHFLAEKKWAYDETRVTLSNKGISRQLTLLKKSIDWLNKVDSIALQVSIQALDTTYYKWIRSNNERAL
jgi:putative transposase